MDAHRDNEVRAVLAPLAALAAELGIAVLLVCHTRKADVAFADDAVLGSRAFVGLSRGTLHLSADPADRGRKLLLPGKINVGASPPGRAFRLAGEPTPRVEWEADPLIGFHADDALAARAAGQPRGPAPVARTAAKRWLAELLRDGPLAHAEVLGRAKEAGLAERTVRRAKEDLGVVSVKSGLTDGWEWRLPGPEDEPGGVTPEG